MSDNNNRISKIKSGLNSDIYSMIDDLDMKPTLESEEDSTEKLANILDGYSTKNNNDEISTQLDELKVLENDEVEIEVDETELLKVYNDKVHDNNTMATLTGLDTVADSFDAEISIDTLKIEKNDMVSDIANDEIDIFAYAAQLGIDLPTEYQEMLTDDSVNTETDLSQINVDIADSIKLTADEQLITEQILNKNTTIDSIDIEEDFEDLIEEPEVQQEQVVDQVVQEPVVEQVVQEPVVEQVVQEPVVEQVVPEPVVEQVVQEPVVEQIVQEPVVEQIVQEPVVEQIVQEPVVEQIVQEPVVEQIIQEPVVEQIVQEPVVEQIVQEPVVEQIVQEPVVEQIIQEPVVEQIIQEPVVEQIIQEPVVEQIIQEPVVEQIIQEPVVEEISLEKVIADNTVKLAQMDNEDEFNEKPKKSINERVVSKKQIQNNKKSFTIIDFVLLVLVIIAIGCCIYIAFESNWLQQIIDGM